MYTKIAMASVLVASSAHAMDGATLQVVGNTTISRAIQWLSSGKPEANIAAGAIAVCVAKSGFDIVSWPIRTWWGTPKEVTSQETVAAMHRRLQALETQGKNVVPEGYRTFTSEDFKTLDRIIKNGGASSSVPVIVSDERVVALEERLKGIEATAALAQDQQQKNTQIVERVQKLESVPVVSAGVVVCSCQEGMAKLNKRLDDFEKQNKVDHANIRSDNLSIFTQKLTGLESTLEVVKSQVKVLQGALKQGQPVSQQ